MLAFGADALARPFAGERLQAGEAVAHLGVVLAFRLWLQFAIVRQNHDSLPTTTPVLDTQKADFGRVVMSALGQKRT